MIISRCFLHFTFCMIAQCKVPYLDTAKIDTNGLKSFIKSLIEDARLTNLIVSNKKRINMDKFYQEMFNDLYVPIQNLYLDNDVEIVQSNDCVLLLNSFEGIRDILNKYKSDFWDIGHFYVLRYIDETGFSARDEILYVHFRAALERLWRLKRIYKVIISIGDKYVYYDPFVSSGAKVVNERESERNVVENESNKFGALRISSKLRIDTFVSRRDFNGYKLIVSTFEYITMARKVERNAGSDWMAMNEICRMMNVDPVYQDLTEKIRDTTSDTFTNTLQQLTRHTSDVGFNGFFIKDYDVKSIEFTGYVTSDSICVVVPKSSAIPNYLAIVRVFSAETWILIIISHIFISVIYLRSKMIFGKVRKRMEFFDILRNTRCSDFILRKKDPIKTMSKPFGNFRKIYGNEIMGFFDAHADMKLTHSNCRTGDQRNKSKRNSWEIYDSLNEKNPKKPFDRISLMYPKAQLSVDHSTTFTWKVLLSSIQPLEMAGDRLSERVVLACSLLLGVVLGGSFTSQLTSSYSKPAFYKNIETLKELEESGMVILTNFKNLQSDVFANDNTSVLSKLQAKLYLANKTEMRYKALVTGKAAVLERKKFLPFSIFGNYQMHVVNECPKQYNLAFVVTKGSVFLPRINEIIGRFQNGGLYGKWFKDMKPNIQEIPTTKLVVIRVNHLYLPFAILLLGLSCGTIIFFCERKGYI